MLAGMAVLAAPGLAIAAADEPEGVITIIVPFGAGTSADLIGRTVASQLAERHKAGVIVDNRVGASGAIGIGAVARAAPNGQTLLFVSNTFVTAAALQSNMPFNVVNDFTPIALTHLTRQVVVAKKGSEITNPQSLVDRARAAPGSLNFGSAGNGTPAHFVLAMIEKSTGVSLTHVPYKSTAAEVNGVLGGEIDLACITLSVAMPHIRAGQMVAVGLPSGNRSATAPDIPTFEEAGIRNVNGDIWFGFLGPAQLPDNITRYL